MKCWLHATATVILALGLARFSYGTDCKPAKYEPRASPYALTLSGGVSLGAYEAGINWALLRFLRRLAENNAKTETEVIPDVAAITGASAGAINTLMSAISWCIAPEKVDSGIAKQYPELANSVSQNLFFQSWVPIGKQELLPRTKDGKYDSSAYYQNSDGVLTRHAFDQVVSKIADIVGLKENEQKKYGLPIEARDRKGLQIFREGCSVPLGFTVTSEAPYEQKVAGLAVRNQRHFIPVRLTVQNGAAVFLNENVDPSAPGVGNVIYLPRATPKKTDTTAQRTSDKCEDDVHYKVENGAVIGAVLTSSAFPVAFGRRNMTFCRPGLGKQDDQCGPNTASETGVFVDGGIFDNIPLGATKVLAEGGDRDADRRVTYLYIDPDQTRNQGRVARRDSDKKTNAGPARPGLPYDISSQLTFLPGSIGSARNYELHKEMASGEWTAAISVKREEVVAELEAFRPSSGPGGVTLPAFDCKAAPLAGKECTVFFQEVKKASADKQESRRFLAGQGGTDQIAKAEKCLAESALDFKNRLQFCKFDAPKDWLAKRQENLDWMSGLIGLLSNNFDAKPIRLKALENGIKRAQNDPLGDRQVFISSRFHPIIGEYLWGFGAFFERSFREFDYYVGVYDAVHSIADKICDVRKEASLSTVDCGEANNAQIDNVRDQLQIRDDKTADYIFSAIRKREHLEQVDTEKMPSPEREEGLKKYSVLLESLATDTCSLDKKDKCLLRNEKFESFLGELSQRKKDLSMEQTDALNYLVKENRKMSDWWLGPVAEVGQRLQDLERSAPDNKGWSQEMGWGTALAQARAGEGFALDVRNDSSYAGPGWVPQILTPSELGYKAGSTGVPYVAWQWHLEFVGVPLPLEAQVKQYCGDACRNGEPWITQAGVGISGSISKFKLGLRVPEVNYLSRDNPDNGRRTGWGWSAFVGWGCLQATYGERSINGDLVTKPKDYYLDLGVKIDVFSWIAGTKEWKNCGSNQG